MSRLRVVRKSATSPGTTAAMPRRTPFKEDDGEEGRHEPEAKQAPRPEGPHQHLAQAARPAGVLPAQHRKRRGCPAGRKLMTGMGQILSVAFGHFHRLL